MFSPPPNATRRSFLKATATSAAVAGTLAVPRHVHAAGSDTLRVGLIGCGGRGAGAAVDAMNADPNCKLVAMADAFEDRLRLSQKSIQESAPTGQYSVKPDRCYVGFEAYQQLIDSEVDVVLLATPPHFRPQHVEAAVDAGKHLFVEKPVAVDAPGIKRVQAACDLAEKKGLCVVSGLCWRYDAGVLETMRRIQDGAIGDVVAIQSTYNTGTLWHRGDKPDWSRMEYQLRNWLYYTWLSGDHICEQAIHSLDKTAWLNDDASPKSAYGIGGRQQRTDPKFGHIFDHHVVTFEYENGVKVYFTCRQQSGCANLVDEHVLGTKGSAWVLKNRINNESGEWSYDEKKRSMYLLEHVALFKAIRGGQPINNGHYMCNSSMIAILGRMATYTGKKLTWEEAVHSEQVLGPKVYEWGDVPEPEVAVPGFTQFS